MIEALLLSLSLPLRVQTAIPLEVALCEVLIDAYAHELVRGLASGLGCVNLDVATGTESFGYLGETLESLRLY